MRRDLHAEIAHFANTPVLTVLELRVNNLPVQLQVQRAEVLLTTVATAFFDQAAAEAAQAAQAAAMAAHIQAANTGTW